MQIWISFPLDSFSSSARALEFIYPFPRMPLLAVQSSRSFREGHDLEDLPAIVSALEKNRDNNFCLLSDGYDLMTASKRILFRKDRPSRTEYFVLSLGEEADVRLSELMRDVSAVGMTFSYISEYTKARWQSEEMLNAYEVEKRPHAHLKKIVDPMRPPLLQTKIDISENPGHARLTYTMKLMAAPEMWFGPGCWAYFDKHKVSSFPDAQEIKWIQDDLLYVRLFDWKMPDYEAGPILDLQTRFRNWSGMNEVEQQLGGLSTPF